MAYAGGLQSGFGEPFAHLTAGKSQPAMGVVEAQGFQTVRSKIDNGETSAGPQQSRRRSGSIAIPPGDAVPRRG